MSIVFIISLKNKAALLPSFSYEIFNLSDKTFALILIY